VARPETVLVLAQPAGLYNATLGGIMATRMQKLGVEGVLVDGNIRDINHIRNLGLPVFAKGVSIVGAGAECRASEIDVPIKVNSDWEVWIHPGDIIVADADGVVCLPPSLAPKVLEMIPRLVAGITPSPPHLLMVADERVLEDVEKGGSVEKAFRDHRGK
jgi:regulator of RNase E activity RraA